MKIKFVGGPYDGNYVDGEWLGPRPDWVAIPWADAMHRYGFQEAGERGGAHWESYAYEGEHDPATEAPEGKHIASILEGLMLEGVGDCSLEKPSLPTMVRALIGAALLRGLAAVANRITDWTVR